jgi:hypothetical protein
MLDQIVLTVRAEISVRARQIAEMCRRAHELMDKNSLGTLTDEEQAELGQLIERADRLKLRKAEGSAILRERGYSFT